MTSLIKQMQKDVKGIRDGAVKNFEKVLEFDSLVRQFECSGESEPVVARMRDTLQRLKASVTQSIDLVYQLDSAVKQYEVADRQDMQDAHDDAVNEYAAAVDAGTEPEMDDK